MSLWKVTISVIVCLIVFIVGCGRKSSYETAEVLFGEIIESDDHYAPQIMANNWETMDILREAYHNDPDDERVRSIFNTFYSSRFDLTLEESLSKSMDIIIEYGSNLLRLTPKDGILLVYHEQIYYPVRYAQDIDGVNPDIPVICGKFLPFKRYRDYLSARYGLCFPYGFPTVKSADDEEYKSTTVNGLRWVADSLGKPVLINMNMPLEARPANGALTYGFGKLYGLPLTNEEIKQKNLEFYSSVLVFDAVADTTFMLPNLVEGMVQWYAEAPLVQATHWLADGDTAFVDTFLSVLIERLPSFWRPASYYFFLHPELSGQPREELIARIERFIKFNPDKRNAQNTLKGILATEGNTGEEK